MSGAARNITKKLTTDRNAILGNGRPLLFPVNMYGNVYGSVAVCWFIFNWSRKKTVERVIELWHKIEKAPNDYIDFEFGDEFFVEKCLNLFNLPVKRKLNNRLAFCKDKWGALCCPIFSGVVMPNREDFFMPISYRNGEIKPVGVLNKGWQKCAK